MLRERFLKSRPLLIGVSRAPRERGNDLRARTAYLVPTRRYEDKCSISLRVQTFSSFCLRVRQNDIGCSRSSNKQTRPGAPRGEFAAVTDGEINRPDNRARCTRRRKETNEQTHNHRRVIYTNHLVAIATAPILRWITKLRSCATPLLAERRHFTSATGHRPKVGQLLLTEICRTAGESGTNWRYGYFEGRFSLHLEIIPEFAQSSHHVRSARQRGLTLVSIGDYTRRLDDQRLVSSRPSVTEVPGEASSSWSNMLIAWLSRCERLVVY